MFAIDFNFLIFCVDIDFC